MAGYFSLGENKIRPGAYFNVQKRGDETNFGAIDGVVAVHFQVFNRTTWKSYSSSGI